MTDKKAKSEATNGVLQYVHVRHTPAIKPWTVNPFTAMMSFESDR